MDDFRPDDKVQYTGFKFRDEFKGPKGDQHPCPRGEVVSKVRESNRTYVVQFRGSSFVMTPDAFRDV